MQRSVGLVFEQDDAFLDWMDKLTDLEGQVAESSAQDILDNAALGATATEREEAYGRGRWASWVINLVGVLAGLWGFLYPRPYRFVVLLLLVLPWAALLIVRQFKGLLRIDKPRGDLHPDVAAAFLMPGFALMLRGLDYDVLNWPLLSGYAVLIGTFLLVAAILSDPSMKKRSGSVVALFLLTFCYGLGAASLANGLLDESKSTLYPASILDKYEIHGKYASYNLKLAPWGPKSTENSVKVPREMYNFVKIGDTVCPTVKKGALGIPTYDVFGCP